MKIVIISPPKSGANRLRCLLAMQYGLRAVDARDAPTGGNPTEYSLWLATLPDGSITHSDLPFDPALLTSAAELGVTFIAIVRHPFDLYLSNSEVRSQRNLRAGRRTQNRDSTIPTLPMRQSSELEYPLDSFAIDLQSLLDWASVAAASVRYEDILEQPNSALTMLAGVLGNLDCAKIARAVELCPAEQRIVSSGNRGVRMAELPPGSWQTHIDAATLDELRSQFRQAVARLGYESNSAS